MAMLGQASGGFTESSSVLRILHLGIRNTVGVLTDDSFTQSNPPVVTGNSTESGQLDGGLSSVLGVLSGSVAFTRPDEGSNYIGGPTGSTGEQALGVFINSAVGNSYENTPGTASGKGPYVSGQGTYANSLFETQVLTDGSMTRGDDLTYACGDILVVSSNGYLTTATSANAEAADGHDVTALSLAANRTFAILKMPADAAQDEIVYDQRA